MRVYFILVLVALIASAVASPTCGENEEYKSCGPACHPTCQNPQVSTLSCPKPCIAGCYCKAGYLTNSQGKCVTKSKCS